MHSFTDYRLHQYVYPIETTTAKSRLTNDTKNIAYFYWYWPIQYSSFSIPCTVFSRFVLGQDSLLRYCSYSMPPKLTRTSYIELNDEQSQRNTSKTKKLIQKHGPLVWKTYWGVYFGTLGATFVGIQSGVFDPVRILWNNKSSSKQLLSNFLQSHRRLSPYQSWIQSTPWLTNFVVAWLVAEALEPVRIAATSILVPILSSSDEKPIIDTKAVIL